MIDKESYRNYFRSLPCGETVIVEFLSSRKDFMAPYWEVAKKLVTEDVLGFGVEPIDIVFEAEQRGIVVFDRQKQEVKLKRVDLSEYEIVFNKQTNRAKLKWKGGK